MKKKFVSPVDDDQLYDDVVVVDVSWVVFVSWLVDRFTLWLNAPALYHPRTLQAYPLR